MEKQSQQVKAVLKYIEYGDRYDFAADVFADNFQFYFPKFGVGHGVTEFMEMAQGFMGAYSGISHQIDLIAESGSIVLVEGRTLGQSAAGVKWKGGETPGGRFCSVFAFDDAGLINRMHIYLDPDYVSEDTARFRWNRGDTQRW